jgi:hypothetical protein
MAVESCGDFVPCGSDQAAVWVATVAQHLDPFVVQDGVEGSQDLLESQRTPIGEKLIVQESKGGADGQRMRRVAHLVHRGEVDLPIAVANRSIVTRPDLAGFQAPTFYGARAGA